MAHNYYGIDISKDTFVVAYRNAEQKEQKLNYHTYRNDSQGIGTFIRSLDKTEAHCVMEITGNYHAKLLYQLTFFQIKVSAINPRDSAYWAKMRGSVTKTDAQDALRLLEYGEQFNPPVYVMPNELLQMIRQKRMVLRQLKRQKRVFANQKHALEQLPKIDTVSMNVIQNMIDTIDKHIKTLEDEIHQTTDKEFEELKKRIMTIKGIGPTIANALIVATDGFQNFDSAKKFAKFIGICPAHYQSGTSVRGKAHISRSGDPELRTLMYNATWSALKGNKACKEFYGRLRAKGKSAKVALIAVANKIIRQVFAVIRKKESFDNNYIPKFQTTC